MISEDAAAAYDRLAADMHATTPAARSKMFGMACLKVGGKAFAGLAGEAMVFKLSGETHARALGLQGAHLFDPSGRNRPMKEWVVVPAAHAAQWQDFCMSALAYVAAAL
jgi:hypothetical protein